MKKSLFALLTILSLNTFASVESHVNFTEDMELIHADENLESPVTKISDVKELLSTMNPDATCMDEYLKRRRQLIVKLSLSPVTIAAGTVVSAYASALGGAVLAGVLSNPEAGVYVDGLLYAVTGMFVGFVGGGVFTITDTNIAAFQLADVDTILKALAEQYRNQSGKKSDRLYVRYTRKNENPVSKQEFLSKLMDLDASGKLCDGSLVKKPKIRLGSRLKFKLARTKHLGKAI